MYATHVYVKDLCLVFSYIETASQIQYQSRSILCSHMLKFLQQEQQTIKAQADSKPH